MSCGISMFNFRTMQTTPCQVPGSVGWIGFGDKTFEFAYSPLEFIRNKTKEHQSPVFKVRVLNKPTIFLTSSNAVKELLEGMINCLYITQVCLL